MTKPLRWKSLTMVVLSLVLLLVAFLAVGPIRQRHVSAAQAPQAPSSTSWNNTVTIVDSSRTGKAAHFSPNMLKLAPGVNLVLWTNATSTPQVVLSDTAAFPPLTVGLDQPQKLLFDKPGIYAFHLASHPAAHLTIVVTALPSLTLPSTITLIPSKTGKAAHFSPAMLKLAPGVNLVLWTNATSTTQVVLSDTAAFPPLTVGLDQPQKLLFDKPGIYACHLASNPAAHLTIVVTALPVTPPSVDNAVTIVEPSKTDSGVQFSPSILKLAPGVNLVLWTNATSTTQVVLSDTAAFPPLTVGLDQPQKLLFDTVGTFTFHLASHPAAHLTIVVTALPSQHG